MSYTIRVDVQLTVEVDAEVWADTYGLQFETVGQKGAALREDIEEHTRAVVLNAADGAMTRLGVEAVVR